MIGNWLSSPPWCLPVIRSGLSSGTRRNCWHWETSCLHPNGRRNTSSNPPPREGRWSSGNGGNAGKLISHRNAILLSSHGIPLFSKPDALIILPAPHGGCSTSLMMKGLPVPISFCLMPIRSGWSSLNWRKWRWSSTTTGNPMPASLKRKPQERRWSLNFARWVYLFLNTPRQGVTIKWRG